MDFRAFVEPQQGATYADQLAVAKAAEAQGYSAFFRSDHYVAMSGDGLPGPTDSWVTLAGIARETTSIRLGTMVTSATFRYPGPLAISVAQVDEMSGGRVELGIGAGWFEAEHRAYAIPFPPLGERFERLREQLDIITGLWTTPVGETFDYSGNALHRRRLAGAAQARPAAAPADHHRRRGRQADTGARREVRRRVQCPVHAAGHGQGQYDRVRAALADAGRSPDSLTYSAAFVVCAGRDDAEVARGRPRSAARSTSCAAIRRWSGTPAEIVDKLGPFAEIGVQRVYLQLLDMSDLDHLELFATEVVPQLG